jgi:AraC-like DNA-binding protein
MKSAPSFEPHLVVNEFRLPRSAEWTPNFRRWSFLQIGSGICYWQEPRSDARELPVGSVLVLTGESRGAVRASQLSEVLVHYFCVEPEKLTGLLSFSEQHSLKRASEQEQHSLRILPPDNPLADKFKNLCLERNGASPFTRLNLLQLFIDLFKSELNVEPAPPLNEPDARERLREVLKQMAASEFQEMSLATLASKLGCTPRHLSRLFREEVGVSFRERQTELRLANACELLATSNAKVIDVALTSGYQSNSVFSLLFKKRFGLSPGKWRERQGRQSPRRQKFVRMLPA